MPSHGCRGSTSAPVIAIEDFVDELLSPDVLAIKAHKRQRPEGQEKRLGPPLRPGGDDAVIYQGDGARRNDDARKVN
jgi:hypothetical protein